jgi:hypothetical protein
VTVRQAVLPIGALLILCLGVYLFVEVRAQPAPPQVGKTSRLPRPAALEAQPQAVRPGAAAPAPPPADHPAAVAPPEEPVVTGAPQMSIRTPPDRGAALDEGPKLDAVMDAANKAYDRGDFEDAKAIAGRVLARNPTNIRMLRIMVSSSCVDGDNALAQAHFANLPPSDQEQMRVRCARSGIKFPDKP